MTTSAPDRGDAPLLPGTPSLAERFAAVRNFSTALAAPLSPEDQVVQSMPDVSPTKWHLAHTTWFFEQFVLDHFRPDYQLFHPRFNYLFNSYYTTVGQMHARTQRGLLSRPTVSEIVDYRRYVDEHVQNLLSTSPTDDEQRQRITLGLHHEQQHQELLLMDIKHVLFQNPLAPAYHDKTPPAAPALPLAFIEGKSGVQTLGTDPDDHFEFDNETPRHAALLQTHELANRLVTNAEYREFMDDGGYNRSELWLSDGWAAVKANEWQRPLYWREFNKTVFTLAGDQPLDPNAPVVHVSYYEADAYARWAGARLPSEHELESAMPEKVEGHFADAGLFHPGGTPAASQGGGPRQLFGDVWEWTASPYVAYPGFRPLPGSLGEYNGKFMCNQMVLRGGACITPAGHTRATYRNFFYPHCRWQFGGIRLARDAG